MDRNENANKCIVQKLWGGGLYDKEGLFPPRGKLALT